MKKFIFGLLIPAITVAMLSACWVKEGKKTSSKRMELHRQGIIIDAQYDPRLDNIVPGYKIITVALTNNGVDILRLNPLKDRWEIVDAYGRQLKAISSLRIRDPRTFSRLPGQMQQLIEYPVGIAVGYAETIDLFFPVKQDLTAFRSISFYSAERDQKFDILANMDSPTHVPANPSAQQAEQVDPRFAPTK